MYCTRWAGITLIMYAEGQMITKTNNLQFCVRQKNTKDINNISYANVLNEKIYC